MSVPTLTSDEFAEVLDVGLAGGVLQVAGHAASTWRVLIGQMVRDQQDWRFSGMHGSFSEFHGVSGRPLALFGEIRCDDAAWDVILDQRDIWQTDSGLYTFVDDTPWTYEYCQLKSWDIQERRRIIVPGTNLCWFAPYRIELLQQVP